MCACAHSYAVRRWIRPPVGRESPAGSSAKRCARPTIKTRKLLQGNAQPGSGLNGRIVCRREREEVAGWAYIAVSADGQRHKWAGRGWGENLRSCADKRCEIAHRARFDCDWTKESKWHKRRPNLLFRLVQPVIAYRRVGHGRIADPLERKRIDGQATIFPPV